MILGNRAPTIMGGAQTVSERDVFILKVCSRICLDLYYCGLFVHCVVSAEP